MQYLYYDHNKKYLVDSDPNPTCEDDKLHKFKWFKRNGKASDFEQTCTCGGIRVILKGFNYNRVSRENYMNRDDDLGFKALLERALEIKNGLEKKVEHKR